MTTRQNQSPNNPQFNFAPIINFSLVSFGALACLVSVGLYKKHKENSKEIEALKSMVFCDSPKQATKHEGKLVSFPAEIHPLVRSLEDKYKERLPMNTKINTYKRKFVRYDQPQKEFKEETIFYGGRETNHKPIGLSRNMRSKTSIIAEEYELETDFGINGLIETEVSLSRPHDWETIAPEVSASEMRDISYNRYHLGFLRTIDAMERGRPLNSNLVNEMNETSVSLNEQQIHDIVTRNDYTTTIQKKHVLLAGTPVTAIGVIKKINGKYHIIHENDKPYYITSKSKEEIFEEANRKLNPSLLSMSVNTNRVGVSLITVGVLLQLYNSFSK